MLVYLCAGAAALFYLIMLPVRVGMAWRSGKQLRAGIMLGPLRYTVQGNVRYQPGEGLIATFYHTPGDRQRDIHLFQSAPGKKKPSPELDAASRSALRWLTERMKTHVMRIHLIVATPDASRTALWYGAALALLMALRVIKPQWNLDLRAGADFSTQTPKADLCGILSCRTGHIILAALVFCRDYLSGRIRTWKSNRLKAS